MSSKTRWPSQASTNEVVEVPMSWEFAGAADLTRTPMVVDGIDQSAGIQGVYVVRIQRVGVGLYNIELADSFPWLLGESLKVGTPLADAAAPFTVKATTDQANYQTPPTSTTGPFVRIQVFDTANALADPPAGHTLWGSLVFRNRRVGS